MRAQAPSFRLMISNIQILLELEDESAPARLEPVEPAQTIRGIVDRYSGVGRDRGVEVVWWLWYCARSDPGGRGSDARRGRSGAIRRSAHLWDRARCKARRDLRGNIGGDGELDGWHGHNGWRGHKGSRGSRAR